MSRPLIGLFKKEWRQHRAMVIGVLCLCPPLYVIPCALGIYYGAPPSSALYLGAALYITILLTWGVAASVYAVEHDKNTFPFLRNLPVSPLTIAIGKIGWAFTASALVLTVNLFCGAVCCFLQGEFPAESANEILLILGPGIAEAFVWGIFWSTRCRNATLAAFAAAACTVLVIWVLLLLFVPRFVSDAEGFTIILTYRLAVIILVSLFAGWGALRWFKFSVKDTRRVWIPRNFVFARYPQSVQHPFLALIHQHLRHASLVYPLGVFCFALWSFGSLLACFVALEDWTIPVFMLVTLGILIFWGNIFGHDQQNGSYRFLTRIGIHEGQVWWSRMLPAALLYLPVLFCFIAFLLVRMVFEMDMDVEAWDEFIFASQVAFTVWFSLLALGAFCSISSERQMIGIAATFGLGFLLFYWSVFFMIGFGSSPTWTTVPVAFAFLVASRLRAGYWLREITTWRSRFIPLLPVFGVILAVCIALPFVRVYSVPYVSWEQLTIYLDQGSLDGIPNLDKDQLMQNYTAQRNYARSVFSGEILEGIDSDDNRYATYFCLRFMPWEEARRERILRLQIVAYLVDTNTIRDSRARAIRTYCERLEQRNVLFPGSGGQWDKVWETI